MVWFCPSHGPPNVSGIDEACLAKACGTPISAGRVSGGPGRGEYDGVESAVGVGRVEVRRVEVAAFFDAEPFQQVLMIGVGGIGEGVDEVDVAVDTAAVFRRAS